MTIVDIHTHHRTVPHGAIIALSPTQYDKDTPLICSLGIHPWESGHDTTQSLQLLNKLSTLPNVVAIGECGIDRLKGADIKSQTKLFEYHIQLSEEVGKPLIIHAVKSADIILALHRQYNPSQKWIIHGYRGNATTAQQYLRIGIELSFGEKYNEEALISTPIDKLWIESDESLVDISEIYNRVATTLDIDTQVLHDSIEMRSKKIFLGCE